MTEILNNANLTDTAVGEIANIENVCFSLPWSENSLKSSAEAGTVYFIYRENKTAAGYIGVTVSADEGYITNLAVLPEYRKRGFGNELILAAVSYAKEHSLSFLTLEVRESNFPARSLYEKQGFGTVAVRKNYYENPRENALIMTRRF